MPDAYPFMELAIALAVGLLIGLERGWKDRADADGSRVAGFRTIGLIGLLGGLAMLIDGGKGFVLAAGFVGLALLLREGFEAQIDASHKVSVTTMVAALTAYTLGALAVSGQPHLAAMGGVATTFILWLRSPFHSFLRRIEEKELDAFLRWLLISIVVLPVLPDQYYGPYNALNPRTIWLMVVLISGLGFLGYLGMKWLGQRRGSVFLALSGGLVSSTATTLAFAKLARQDQSRQNALLAGTAVAWAMMFIRTFVIVSLLTPALLTYLYLPLGAMLIVSVIAAVILYSRNSHDAATNISISNPLDLKSAGMFAILLTIAMALSKAAAQSFGDMSLFMVSIVAGAIDIEAISLSMTQMAGHEVGIHIAANAIALAAIANTIFKSGIAVFSGGASFGRHCLFLALLLAATGGLVLWLTWS